MIPHSKSVPSQLTHTNSGGSPTIIEHKNESKQPEKNEPPTVKVSEPKIEASRSPSKDIVNTSITSLPQIADPVKISELIEGKEAESKKLSDQRSISSSQLVSRTVLEESRILSKSAINLNELKNIQFKKERVIKPEKS
jgi:hypothetical protein